MHFIHYLLEREKKFATFLHCLVAHELFWKDKSTLAMPDFMSRKFLKGRRRKGTEIGQPIRAARVQTFISFEIKGDL